MATTVATLVAKLQADSSQFKAGMAGAQRDVDTLTGKSKSAFAKLGPAAKLAGAAVAAGIAAGAVKSVGAFVEFEKGMNEVFTLLPGISDKAMGQMEDDVKDLSKEFGITTKETVPALYQALSAGVPKDNVFEFMETAARAAKGGATDLETAVDGITSATNAYGVETLSAERASDIMFTTVRLGKTDFEQLSGAMFQVAPIAAGAGIAFEDVGAALAVITGQGVPTSVAATQIKGAVAEMGKEGSIAFQNFEKATGQTFPEFIAAGGTLEGAFAAMKQHADDTGTGVQNLFGSIEAGQAAIALTSDEGAPKFAAAMQTMQDSSGATQGAFETMEQGIGATWDKIKANVETALIDVGGRLAPLVSEWSEAFLRVLPGAIDFTIGAVEKIVGFIQNFIRGVQEILGWFKKLPGPITSVAVALGAVATALALLYANPVIAGLALVAGAVAFIGAKAGESERRVAELEEALLDLEGKGSIDESLEQQIETLAKNAPDAVRAMNNLGLSYKDIEKAIKNPTKSLGEWIREQREEQDQVKGNIHDLKELEKAFDPLEKAYDNVAEQAAKNMEEMRREHMEQLAATEEWERRNVDAFVRYEEEMSERLTRAGDSLGTFTSDVGTDMGTISEGLAVNEIDWMAWEEQLGASMEGTRQAFVETTEGMVNGFTGATEEIELTAEQFMDNLEEEFAQQQEYEKLFKELGEAGMFGLQQALVDGGPGAVSTIRDVSNDMSMAFQAELRLSPHSAMQYLKDNFSMYGHWFRVYGSDLARMLESGWNPFLPIPQPGDAPANKPPPASVAGNPPGAPVDDRPRQHGGPVSAYQSYLVGERGPELFLPATSGRIIPNGGFGFGGGDIHVYVEGNLFGAATADELVEILEDARRRHRLRGGAMI